MEIPFLNRPEFCLLSLTPLFRPPKLRTTIGASLSHRSSALVARDGSRAGHAQTTSWLNVALRNMFGPSCAGINRECGSNERLRWRQLCQPVQHRVNAKEWKRQAVRANWRYMYNAVASVGDKRTKAAGASVDCGNVEQVNPFPGDGRAAARRMRLPSDLPRHRRSHHACRCAGTPGTPPSGPRSARAFSILVRQFVNKFSDLMAGATGRTVPWGLSLVSGDPRAAILDAAPLAYVAHGCGSRSVRAEPRWAVNRCFTDGGVRPVLLAWVRRVVRSFIHMTMTLGS